MFSSNCASVPLVANIDGNNNGNGMFGGDGLWGLIIILALLGWGGNGFGGFGGFGGGNGGTYGASAEIQRGFDNQSVLNKLNGLENGLCDGFYAQNTSMLQGFNGLQQTLCQGFNGVNTAILQSANGTERGFAGLSSQLAQCCCDNRAAIADVKYQMATQACDTRNLVQNTTRDIIDNANANNRAILDFLVNDKLSTLQAENQALKFKASQAEQNSFIAANQQAQTAELIRRLGADCPTPAYLVPNPNCCYNAQVSFGNGCGCGSY